MIFTGKKKTVFIYACLFLVVITVFNLIFDKTARAIPVEVLYNSDEVIDRIVNKVGTVLVQNTARKVINDMAYQSATWIGSGGRGQKPLFLTEDWGSYFSEVADNAVGDAIISFTGDYSESAAKEECASNKDECLSRCADSGTSNDCTERCLDAEVSCNSKVSSTIINNKNSGSNRGNLSIGGIKFDICNPSLDLSLKITLGLSAKSNKYKADCSFSEMSKNWKTEYDKWADMNGKDLLEKLANSFEPGGNDLSIALTVLSKTYDASLIKKDNAKTETASNAGWLNIRSISGSLLGTPLDSKETKELTGQAMWDNIDKVAGDLFVDAANIFLNQLALSSFQNLMRSLGDSSSSTSDLTNPYSSEKSTGSSGIKNKLSTIKEPQFSEGGEFDIINKLLICQDIDNPGPTDCVIDNKMANAITNEMTVGEAFLGGQLGDLPFGFDKNGNDTILYNQGYPYRSLIILRKYRILPVGWELAAQKIRVEYSKTDASASVLKQMKPNGISLGDLLSCYSGVTNKEGNKFFNGFDQEWCHDLIDPKWVLKAPANFCAKKGYGPMLLSDANVVSSGKKYCSFDNGATKAKVNGEYIECTDDASACGEAKGVATAEDIDKGYASKDDVEKGKVITRNVPKCNYNEMIASINRKNDYCADEQSCIKEKNGKCLFYGYCTEERRTWKFGKDQNASCDPLYNTCQSFIKDGGNVKASFLKNTLDYSFCTADVVGCKPYARLAKSYDNEKDIVYWDDSSDSKIHFNKNVKTCANNNEGCHEFIRLTRDSGTNLITNGTFEALNPSTTLANGLFDNYWPIEGNVSVETANSETSQVKSGSQSLYIKGEGGLYSLDGIATSTQTILPKGFEFEIGETYSLSAWIYVKNGTAELGMGNSSTDNWQKLSSTVDDIGSWKYFILTADNTFDLNINKIYIKGLSSTDEIYIDNLSLQIGSNGSTNMYGEVNKVYQKMLPVYLNNLCYKSDTDFDLKTSGSEANNLSKCYNYTRKCNKENAGCNNYTNIKTEENLSAIVKKDDYCPKECLNFDTYIQKDNNFNSKKAAYFIPKTAQGCKAASVGCSKFVNLDKLKQGGESDEYYSYMRKCMKNDNTQCSDFYIWESGETGKQIINFRLKTKEGSSAREPAVTSDDSNECNEDIYNLTADDPQFNPDCQKFYGRDGYVSYHLYSKTISCSDKCLPYRKVVNNVDSSISQSDCTGEDKHWDVDNNQCIVCVGGGIWDDTVHKACIYNALAAESDSCSASQDGCSEYVGNIGSNIRTIFNDTFEIYSEKDYDSGFVLSPTSTSWTNAVLVKESSREEGHSIVSNNATLIKNVDGLISKDKYYSLSFLAKKGSSQLAKEADIEQINFIDKNGNITDKMVFTEDVSLDFYWKRYSFGVYNLDSDNIDRLEIKFKGSTSPSGGKTYDKIFLDNIKLTEFSDRYFLIKDSWKTPDSCNQTNTGEFSPLYMLGCSQYKNQENKVENLKSFKRLCSESVVGCEAFIDTQNSSNSLSSNVKGIVTKKDEVAYIIYSKNRSCDANSKGCTRMGVSNIYGGNDNFYTASTYLINDPDDYNSTLCESNNVNCAAWNNDNGQFYFKDPGDDVCEWRQRSNSNNFAWFKKLVKRCGASLTKGQVCSSDSDCNGNTDETFKKCLEANTDMPCSVDGESVAMKTIGTGAPIQQPTQPAVCPTEQSGCTEYIDPISSINTNLLNTKNNKSSQILTLENDVLYSIDSGDSSVNVSVDPGGSVIYFIDNNSNIISSSSGLKSFSRALFFFSSLKNSDSPVVTIAGFNSKSSLRKTSINYRFKQNVDSVDKPIEVDYELGQILFNERGFEGSSYKPLIYDAFADYGKTKTPIPGINANALLKVSPDRECDKWLGCKLYVTNPINGASICYDRSLCNQIDANGNCSNFIVKNEIRKNSTYGVNLNADDIYNLSGYSKVGYDGYDGDLQKADLYHPAFMSEGKADKINFNGSFEESDSSGFMNTAKPYTPANPYIAEVINDARNIQKEVGYNNLLVPDGKSIASTSTCVSKKISGLNSDHYVFSAKVFIISGKANLNIGVKDIYNEIDAAVSRDCPFYKFDKDGNNNGAGFCESANNITIRRAVLAETSKVGSWVELIGDFYIDRKKLALPTGGTSKEDTFSFGVCSNGGKIYFDDLKIEPSLEAQCDKPAVVDGELKGCYGQNYISSSCRLYPNSSSLSCDGYNKDGVREKGWSGYCLEKDPKNPKTCLMWYPLDKINGEDFEEGAALAFNKDVFYCIDGENYCDSKTNCNLNDQTKEACTNSKPVESKAKFYCKEFVRVDKNKYWYSRINKPNEYVLPYGLFRDPSSEMNIKFSGSQTVVFKNSISSSVSNGLYGAYNASGIYSQGKITLDKVGDGVYPYLSYFGKSNAFNKDNGPGCFVDTDIHNTSGDNNQNQYDTIATVGWDKCVITKANASPNAVPFDDGLGPCYPNGSPGCNESYCLCEGGIECKVENDDGKIYLKNRDAANDGRYTWCDFKCFLGTEYNIAVDNELVNNQTRSIKAVKRLFASNADKKEEDPTKALSYQWTNNTYSFKQANYNSWNIPSNACPNNIRPAYNYNGGDDEADYCFVKPQVNKVFMPSSMIKEENGKKFYIINGRGWLPLRFTSLVDKEQLPLRSYEVNLGYKIDNQDEKIKRTVNMFSHDKETNPHTFNYFVDYQVISGGSGISCGDGGNGIKFKGGVCPVNQPGNAPSYCYADCSSYGLNKACCVIKPSVAIVDNWDISSDKNTSSTIDYDVVITEE